MLLQSFHWGSVFLLAVPVMALLLAIGPRLLPEYKDPEPGRLDLASAALSLVAVLAVIYGIKAVAKDGVDLGEPGARSSRGSRSAPSSSTASAGWPTR